MDYFFISCIFIGLSCILLFPFKIIYRHLLSSSLKKYLFILREREKTRERVNSHPWVHSLHAWYSQNWAWLNLGARHSVLVSSYERQGLNMSHHLLPPATCIRQKLAPGMELERKPRRYDMGWDIPSSIFTVSQNTVSSQFLKSQNPLISCPCCFSLLLVFFSLTV